MILLDNVTEVAKLDSISDDTVRRWIKIFNDGGLEALSKKNDPDDPRF
jgi:transposase